MFVTSIDRGFFSNPFLRQTFRVESSAQISTLQRAGIESVTIDPDLSIDPSVTSKSGKRGRGKSSKTTSQTESPPDQAARQPSPSVDSATVKGEARPVFTLPEELEGLSQELIAASRAKARLELTVERLWAQFQTSRAIDAAAAGLAVNIAREITIVAQGRTDAAWFTVMSAHRAGASDLASHSLTTCAIAIMLAQAAHVEIDELEAIALGALLHDVGLLALSPTLLDRINNTSRIPSRKELDDYHAHPLLNGIQTEESDELTPAVRQIIAEHHALPNGRGFPAEIGHHTTARASRIVTIADRYDDLLTGFGGARALHPHDALQRLAMEAQERAVDTELTATLLDHLGPYPIYSVVALNSGERAVVTELNAQSPHQPMVCITHAANGTALTSLIRLNLSRQESNNTLRTISHTLGTVRIPI